MSASVVERGVDEVGTTLTAAGEALDDLARPGGLIAARLEALVDPPVVTGRLASTVHAEVGPTGVTLTAGGTAAPYAAQVHARNPFLVRATDAAIPDAVNTVADHVDDVTATIKGA